MDRLSLFENSLYDYNIYKPYTRQTVDLCGKGITAIEELGTDDARRHVNI